MTRPVTLLMLLAALLACSIAAADEVSAQAAASAVAQGNLPALGRLRIFDDWAVGCDNRLFCSAVALKPETAGINYKIQASIERQGGPDGAATIRLSGANELRGKLDLFVDNQLRGSLVAARDSASASGDVAMTLIRTLGSSYAFEIRQGTAVLDAPSLSGLAQALRYIDEQQGRVGSQGALAALGDKPADLAKPVPTPHIFEVTVATAPDGPVALSEAEQQAARKLGICDGRAQQEKPLELHPLDAAHVLVLMPCDAGAYNVSSVPLVASGEAGSRSFQVARFDLIPGATGEPGLPPLMTNAKWNPARGELASFARGSALGDCGAAETYRWDGAMFRLIEARSMPVCRGAWEWPMLWTATPAGAGDLPPTVASTARAPAG